MCIVLKLEESETLMGLKNDDPTRRFHIGLALCLVRMNVFNSRFKVHVAKDLLDDIVRSLL